MRTHVFFFAMFMIATIGFFNNIAAQHQVDDPTGPQIKVDKMVHDYGTLEQGAFGECVFVITNTGDEPLIISECRGSCACTIPSWPKEPIMPGTSARIVVKYDTNRIGPINKTVTITSNALNLPLLTISIKGNVITKTTVTPPTNQ